MLNNNRVRCILLLISLFASEAYSWNSFGHRLVVQIAYNHLSPNAKKMCNLYNQALAPIYGARTLVDAAPWLDSLRSQKDLWLQPGHYINIPFSRDGTALLPPNTMNAIFAIEEAITVLNTRQTSLFDKGFSLRILLHVVGDIHQPMHAVSQFSRTLPKGDKGGNLRYLVRNPVARNLHSYWDKGGGLLTPRAQYSYTLLNRRANSMERRWPCHPDLMVLTPKIWAEESHTIAVTKAYVFNTSEKPTKSYQKMVKKLSEQQIALAGCRLAALVNSLFLI